MSVQMGGRTAVQIGGVLQYLSDKLCGLGLINVARLSFALSRFPVLFFGGLHAVISHVRLTWWSAKVEHQKEKSSHCADTCVIKA